MQVKSRNIWNKDFTVQYLNFQAQSLLVSKHISSKKQKLSHKRVSLHWWEEIVTYPWEPNQHLCLQYCRALSWLFLLGFPNSLCSLWCSFAELRAPRLHQAEVRLSLNHWGCWRATPALPVELGWAFFQCLSRWEAHYSWGIWTSQEHSLHPQIRCKFSIICSANGEPAVSRIGARGGWILRGSS